MLIVTRIYGAVFEPAKEPDTGKAVEWSVADLKDASRNLLSVYQGTNRVHPIDGER